MSPNGRAAEVAPRTLLGRLRAAVRDGKGGVDRVVPLPLRVQGPLADHLARWRARHARDVERGGGRVVLPGAFEHKVADAATEWAWQWVFPAQRTQRDRASGEERRHHLHESAIQRAV